jgi:transposase
LWFLDDFGEGLQSGRGEGILRGKGLKKGIFSMDVRPVFSLPDQFEVSGVELAADMLTIYLVSLQEQGCCPVCASPARRVHSHYQRTVADLSCMGKPVRLLIGVRKFFCAMATCGRKICVERLSPFIEAWARATVRRFRSVQRIGLATSGMLGERLASDLRLKTSWKTILRRIMALPDKPSATVVEMGIDDFSFRRGRKFGSLVVDMQNHEVIDVLPDRTAETVKVWMHLHPEIQLVSRDRGGEFASAAREALPQATQVADRFHLYKNLNEAVERTLVRCRRELR